MAPDTRAGGTDDMRKPGLVAVGVVVGLLGLLFTLQGVGVITGSTMSNTAFWSVAGPVILVVGLLITRVGIKGRLR